ncbi:putative coactivator CBP, KIX domain superfamily, mediator complex subunit 15, KIX [Helianthus annuus]|nr:putative coactivator CBP, KIX domain superfamily, mediator complex subunit 15, KIX [Helianthus annuus]
MDILRKYLPFYRYDRLQELKKIAERVEKEVYTAATTQSEYSRRICLNMLIMETRLQNRMLDPTSVPLATTANGGDWQEEVYQKIKTMKDLYLLDLRFMHIASGTVGDGAVGDAILESDDWRVQLRTDSRQRVVNKMYVLALC